jgi:hypothetical protein
MCCRHYQWGIVADQLKNQKRSIMERFSDLFVSV